MKKSWFSSFVITILLSSPVAADEWIYTGRVTSIVDGDTFYMETAPDRIRFAGVDTPEKGKPCYQEAGYKLSELIECKTVEATCYKVDSYNRPVCQVHLNGEDIGLTMVRLGYAWHSNKWAHEQRKSERRQYADTEHQAMKDGKGCLWAETYPSTD
jgi:endonuclease YncB( thermonuclease family)